MEGVSPVKIIYHVSKNGVEASDASYSNLTIYKQASSDERNQFLTAYELPSDVFNFFDMPSIAPRIEYLNNKKLGPTMIFVLANISENPSALSVEERLESHTFILSSDQLFWFINKGVSNLYEELFASDTAVIQTLESIIMSVGLLAYQHFADELRRQKQTIDYLVNQADHKTSNEILINVANTERDMVMLEHTLDTQEQAFSKLLADRQFIKQLNNDELAHDIKWYNRQVNKLVHLYRDLLDTVSALFSDIMSNSLNKLMKFLSSLSLILSSAGLIAELWGMNTGGLPGEQSDYGTLVMFSVAFIAGLAMYLFLNKRNYFDD